MYSISQKISYPEGLAYYHAFLWYIEKFRGNLKQSEEAITRAKQIVSELDNPDEYIYHFVLYSYASDQWFSERNPRSSKILEKCAIYFFKNGLYRSLAQTMSFLGLIYTRTQKYDQALELFHKVKNEN